MNMKGFQHYKDESVLTMTQGELLLMLYDELVKRLMRAGLALDQGNFPVFEESVQRSMEIVRYLDNTLDRRYPISRELHRLYDFFGYDLNRVKYGRNKKELERVTAMVRDLRESFQTAERTSDAGK